MTGTSPEARGSSPQPHRGRAHADPNRYSNPNVAALAHARRDLLTFCSRLTEADWRRQSAAAHWSVQDVVTHLGASCHAIFTPAAVAILRSNDIERANDTVVNRHRSWSPAKTQHEYETWSRRLLTLARIVDATPSRRIPVRLAELGRFPVGSLLTGAFVFDHHTHLRFDLAPVLNVDMPPAAPVELRVAIEWMTAVLSNQIKAGAFDALSAPITLNLGGSGGGHWTVSGAGVKSGTAPNAVATITGSAAHFPAWGTRRTQWCDQNLELRGDVDYAAAFLDQLNVI